MMKTLSLLARGCRIRPPAYLVDLARQAAGIDELCEVRVQQRHTDRERAGHRRERDWRSQQEVAHDKVVGKILFHINFKLKFALFLYE